ncbi:MAG: cysteine--tRNA ligase [Patescibacteria group bacterium]|mgnify:FL=1
MQLKIYNTLTRHKETFKALHGRRAGLYTCGPTVYSYAHIGNLRTYIFEDILRRTLEYAGYQVRHVMNITDVEDKIIRDAKKSGMDIASFTAPYERAFLKDLATFNILRAWKYPKATAHIPEMTRLIGRLLKRGLAYQADGSIYFAIAKFAPYGKLSRLKRQSLEPGARVDSDEYAKDRVEDFVLWKAARPGEPSWHAPFGEGRPGWHIECSAMAMKYLGSTLDIHAGGVDLIFPHHENEIAQSEGATGKPFARFFAEGEHLLVNHEKMSKSLGNVFTLRDIEARGADPLAFRYLVLTAHYRSQMNFKWESLAAAHGALQRLYDFVRTLQGAKKSLSSHYRGLTSIVKKFDAAVSDDFNTPKALAAVWDLVAAYHKKPEAYDPAAALAMLCDFDRVLGLGLKSIKKESIPAKVKALVAERESARKKKDWKKADDLRKKVKALGYLVKDTPEGAMIGRET